MRLAVRKMHLPQLLGRANAATFAKTTGYLLLVLRLPKPLLDPFGPAPESALMYRQFVVVP